VRVATLVICFALSCLSMWGQASATSQIGGTVRDSTGLAVPGAKITATQSATGLTRSAVSNADGSYVITNLPTGPYSLEVEKEGFEKYVQSGIVLQVSSNPTIDVVLNVGAVTQQVSVEANAAMVESHSTGIGTVVNNQNVNELPLDGRNATELVLLVGTSTPGTGQAAGQAVVNPRSYPAISISVAGGTGTGVNYQLDGAYYNDAFNGLNFPIPFPDALQEFKVETSALPAQYGFHSNATVNAVTKAGSNQFHGDAFDYFRNGDLDSRDFFAIARDTLRRNQFGGTIGGPIRKDKLFFFAGYQGTIQKSNPTQDIAYVPTSDMLAGNFSTIASPACNEGKQITLPASLGFVNNQISPSLLNPAALTIDSRLPVPINNCGQTLFGLLNNDSENLGVGRIDYQMSAKQSLFLRVMFPHYYIPSTYNGTNALTDSTNQANYMGYLGVFGDTYVFSPNLVSSFRLAANRMVIRKPSDDFATWNDLGVNASSLVGESARITVSGNGFLVGFNSFPNRAIQGPSPNISEDISWIKGSHQLGFGVSFLHTEMTFLSALNAAGSFTFNGSVTGLPLADFLLGSAFSWSQGNPNNWYLHQTYIGLYAQDSWKVNSRLSLNYGLRWEPYMAPYSKYGWFAHFDPAGFAANEHSSVYSNAPAGMTFPGDSTYVAGNSPTNSRYNNWAPRVGLVWDPAGNGRTTVRASYGIFTDREILQSFSGFTASPPYGDNITLNNVSLSNPWATYPGGNPLPIALNKDSPFPLYASYTTNPFNFKPTYMNQWNLSIQRQVAANWLVTANYVGNSTIHLETDAQLNPAVFLGLGPCTISGVSYKTCSTTANTNQRRLLYLQNPAQGQYYGSVANLDDGGTGEYGALLLSVQRRLSRGVSALANYTWSHCISDYWDPDPGTGSPENIPGNRRQFRSNCAAGDIRQVFNLSLVASTPQFRNKPLRWIASDWQLSPIMKVTSAQLFSVTTGVDGALTGQPAETPNLASGVNPYVSNHSCSPAPCYQWMTPAAFSAPAAGQYGNLGLMNLKGPGFFQLDLALTRTFPIRERISVQVRAEAFNLPNWVNFSVPVSTTNSAAFGQIQGDSSGTYGLEGQTAGDPRILQLALKAFF
jgi:outer membrane receptor protein involved in Fe transport